MKTILLLSLLGLISRLTTAHNIPVSSNPHTSPSTSTTFTSGATWQYLVASAANAPDPGWKSSFSYNDTSAPWYTGSSPLGYGLQGNPGLDITTERGTCVNQCATSTTPSCLTCTTKEITTYFRKTVGLTGVSGASFLLRYQRDDGILIYINGTEVLREYMPSGTITHTTSATAYPADAEEKTWVTVDPARYTHLLREGQNLIAVEIHQVSSTSSDIRFNMELLQHSGGNFTSGATWQYLVASAANAPDPGWKSSFSYNDASAPWYAGSSPLGYGLQGSPGLDITTERGTCVNQCATSTTPSCLTCTTKEITTYFRKTINLTGVAGTSFLLRYQRDDGILIYINGTEVLREYMPSGTITHTTSATAYPADAEEKIWVTVDPARYTHLLREGQNLIAVEIHQVSSTSSDIRFNMELQRQGGPTITRGPYLQMGTQKAATIRWRTNIPTSSQVTFGTSVTALTGIVSNTATTTEHEVRVTGLTHAQKYFYSVGTTSTVLEQGPNNYFLTAPLTTTKDTIRIASFGDCGQNNDNQAWVRDAFLKFRGNTPTDLWLLMGDNAYDGYDEVYQTKFFNPYKDNLLKNSMLFPTPGNHDYLNRDSTNYNIPYYSVFTVPQNAEAGGVPSNTKAYYSFDYGPVHFVMLDSYGTSLYNGVQKRFYEDTTVSHAQVNWLKQDLAATTQKWKIVYMHHPPYTRGTHDSEPGLTPETTEYDLIKIRKYINPILEQYGVDMVVTGHDHVYERSYAVHNHYGNMGTFNPSTHIFPEDMGSGRYENATSCPYKNTSEKKVQGTVYVVSGTAGNLEYNQVVAKNLSDHPVMVKNEKRIGGSFYMEVIDNRLDAKFIQNLEGVPGSYTITDQFTMMKDVDRTQSLTLTSGQSITLSASFISDYTWTIPGNPSFSSVRSVVVTPTSSTTYVVRDSKGCLQDIFMVQVGAGSMYSVKTGNWTDPTVWSGNRVPVAGDSLQLKHLVSIPSNVVARAFKIVYDAGQTLQFGTNARLHLSP